MDFISGKKSKNLVEGWHTSRSSKAILSLNAVAPM